MCGGSIVKITKNRLKQIIAEEINKFIEKNKAKILEQKRKNNGSR
tara:strand:+ start:232 stop:366 length:135 start_codon:yes stop_codon:yes gene_type:complete